MTKILSSHERARSAGQREVPKEELNYVIAHLSISGAIRQALPLVVVLVLVLLGKL